MGLAYVPINQYIGKEMYISTTEYYSTIMNNEIMSFFRE
jgi:hypothetical protein